MDSTSCPSGITYFIRFKMFKMKIDIVKEKVNQEYLGIQGDDAFVMESIKLAWGSD